MKKVLTVCGLGQGTSLILKMNVEQAMSDKGYHVDVENTDLSSSSSMDADYIFTSNELSESLREHSAKVIVINSFFDMEEINESIEQHVE